MTFSDGITKLAGYCENTVLLAPLKESSQLQNIDSEMPDELFIDLQEYVLNREKILNEANNASDNDDGLLPLERQYMSKQLMPMRQKDHHLE